MEQDMHIEDELKQALRAEDPGAAFTQRVLARAREERTRPGQRRDAIGAPIDAPIEGGPRADASTEPTTGAAASGQIAAATTRFGTGARRLIAAVAATIVLAAAGLQWRQHQQYLAEGERARAQVLTALRLTSEKLNQVHDAITESTEAR